MPPIPIYADSPVAAKPSGVTPQTAVAGAAAGHEKTTPATVTASPTQSRTSSYPEAKPGAVPSLPAPTGTAAAPSRAAYIPPTPTQGLVDKSDAPPPPQPGAAPQPTASRTTHLPPPPKDGEKYVSPQSAPAPSYPQQMSIPPPTMAYPAQQSGTMAAAPPPSTTTMYSSQIGAGSGAQQSLEHPPGYQQNADASELDRYQQSAIRRNESGYEYGSDDDEGVWNSAKKWAQATGEKLVAAETEVWKRINKQ
ncbi:hypothetical protein E8E14_012984 [Neopestalotiopsis sp. 37M]|nr:hypothetical protein E8E14_012984 [Neopestalotiopsis sp. 37M]